MRILKKTIVLAMVIGLLTVTVSAATQEYHFAWGPTNTAIGSMRWSYQAFVSNGGTAYASISPSVISTFSFMTPQSGTIIQATNVKTMTTATTYHYTWNSSYGGNGTSYYMAAYPDPAMFPWPIYGFTATYGN